VNTVPVLPLIARYFFVIRGVLCKPLAFVVIDCLFVPYKFFSAAAVAAILSLAQIPDAQTGTADLLLLHGHILTIDDRDSIAQALAVRNGVIVKVGIDAEVLEFAARYKIRNAEYRR